MKKIKLAWKELNYSTAKGVLILHPSTPTIAPATINDAPAHGVAPRKPPGRKNMMAQAMEAVIRFLAEEAVSLGFGFLGGAAYYRCRLWNLKRQAPSAEVITANIALSQQDYDHLASAQRWPGWCGRKGKLDEYTQYSIVKR